jgi:pyrimidine-nucleoside phosphorylase
LEKFHQMVAAQGGDLSAKLPAAKQTKEIAATATGYVHSIECDQLGYAVIALGGGRTMASDTIDFAVGFERPKKIGDPVTRGESLIVMHYNDPARAAEAERMVQQAYDIRPDPVVARPKLIVDRVD